MPTDVRGNIRFTMADGLFAVNAALHLVSVVKYRGDSGKKNCFTN